MVLSMVGILGVVICGMLSAVCCAIPPVEEPKVFNGGNGTPVLNAGEDLREWFTSHGLRSNSVRVAEFGGVPWLIAAYAMKAGDDILRVPAEDIVRGDKLGPSAFSEVSPALANELYETALWLLDNQNKHSIGGYFKTAQGPKPAIFWSNTTFLEGSPITDQIRVSRAEIDGIYAGIVEHFNKTTPILKYTVDDFEQAVSFVLAHSIELVVDRVPQNTTQSEEQDSDDNQEQKMVDVYAFFLAPGMDKPRHSPTPNAQIVIDSKSGDLVLRALEPIAQGTEITVNRGNFSNNALLMRFGYVIDQNPSDDYPLRISISPEEENLALKQAILRSVNLPDKNLTVRLDRSELSEGFLSLLRLHFASRTEIGNYQSALEGKMLSLENEWGVCRRILETVSTLLTAYPRDIPTDLETLGALDRGDIQLPFEQAMGLRYTVGERTLLLSVARNVQLHWMDLLMTNEHQNTGSAPTGESTTQPTGDSNAEQ